MKTFLPIQTDNYDLNRIAESVGDVLNPLANSPYLNGQLLENITLTANVDNVIDHKLDRPLRFWNVARGPVLASTFSQVRVEEGLTTAASQAILTGGLDKINLNTLIYSSTGGADSGTNKRINILNSGDYEIKGCAWITNGAALNGRLEVYIKLNGTTYIAGSALACSGQPTYGGPVVYSGPFVAGDYVELWVGNSMPGTVTVVNGSGITYLYANMRQPASTEIYEIANALPNKYLTLRTARTCTVSLWVG